MGSRSIFVKRSWNAEQSHDPKARQDAREQQTDYEDDPAAPLPLILEARKLRENVRNVSRAVCNVCENRQKKEEQK